MATTIIEIDHLMCKIDDLDQGRRTYERLGFTLTPFSKLEMMKGGNSLVLMHPRTPGAANFIELAYMERGQSHPLMSRILTPGEGVKTIVNLVRDAEQAREAWVQAGLTVLPVIPIERTTHLPTGEDLHYQFKVVIPEPGQAPLMFNGYTTTTSHHYLRPDYQNHPNTAQRWTALTGVVAAERLDEAVAFYERIFGVKAVRQDHTALLKPRDVEFRLTTPDGLQARYPGVAVQAQSPPFTAGYTVAVTDMNRLATLLGRNGIRSVRVDASLCVPPTEACGALLEFVPDN